MGNWYEVARLCTNGKKNNLVAVTWKHQWIPKNHSPVPYGSQTTPYGPVKNLRGKGNGMKKTGRVGILFLNFYMDYYILHVEEDYSTSIISDQTGTRLHILSRRPSLSVEEVSSIRMNPLLGYDPENCAGQLIFEKIVQRIKLFIQIATFHLILIF